MATDTPRTYRERREARAERLRTWAASRERRADASAASVDALAATIPLGQPILVGHHSQRRAERDHERIERGTRRTIEHTDKARAFRQRAGNIDAAAARAVYSDDPDVAAKLRERLAELVGERDTIKAYNAAARKGAADPGTLPDKLARELDAALRAWGATQCPQGQFPGYVLRNLSANIARNKRRLTSLTEGECPR
jgi:Domain of unknown function (DUF3560)